MRARFSKIVLLAAAGVAGAVVAVRPGSAAPGDTQIAVVSVLSVIQDSPQKTDIEARQKERENEAKAYATEQEGKLKQLHAELQGLSRTDPKRRQKEDEYVLAESRVEAELKIRKARALDDYTSAYENLHQDVKAVAGEVARDRGIKLVLFRTDDPINLRSPGEFAVNVGMRTVVWAAPDLDITDAVKTKLAARATKTSGGTPPPPPPPGPAPTPAPGPAMDATPPGMR